MRLQGLPRGPSPARTGVLPLAAFPRRPVLLLRPAPSRSDGFPEFCRQRAASESSHALGTTSAAWACERTNSPRQARLHTQGPLIQQLHISGQQGPGIKPSEGLSNRLPGDTVLQVINPGSSTWSDNPGCSGKSPGTIEKPPPENRDSDARPPARPVKSECPGGPDTCMLQSPVSLPLSAGGTRSHTGASPGPAVGRAGLARVRVHAEKLPVHLCASGPPL